MAQEKDPKDIPVQSAKDANDKQVVVYAKGDPVVATYEGKKYIGTIENIDKDQVLMKVKNFKDVSELTTDVKSLQPLFFENKEGLKIWTKFSYTEIMEAQKNTPDFKASIEKDMITSLMLGNRTDLVKFAKKIKDNMATVEGKFELKRNADGLPVFNHITKFKELNLDKPVYGQELTEAQKSQLKTTGELGLVAFKSGAKDFNLWVSVDPKLNQVVTKGERDVNIKFVFGTPVSEEAQNLLKKGEGAVVTLKNNEKIYMAVSAASNKADGIKTYSYAKALEFGLIKEKAEEQTQKKTKTVKV
ncbi:hypothetical protein Q361_11719 [Flavobacterium croceum DSM 17960]|uniref:DUF3945 domain-containing protein n=1 Tax=Flavobacterium croceum DSM 17960 TaxID=1121886 RepID=A0A2S4N5H0_9FLAO|nr:hypothetical protein [Flavobacterium croceum]POS00916.1 hypothetical protein Q361_11719 [Flavobacterium croceum DSM 17960]